MGKYIKNTAQKNGFKLTDDSVENRETVNSYLLSINGRATSHTRTELSELVSVATMAEAELDRAGVAKSARVGCLAVQCDGGAGKKSYQYAQTVTLLRLRRFAEGWRLMEARRAESRPLEPTIFEVSIPAKYIYQLRAKATMGFTALPKKLAA